MEKSKTIESALAILKKNLREESFLFSHSLRAVAILKEMGISDQETIIAELCHHLPTASLSLENLPQKTKEEILNIIKKSNSLRKLFSSKKDFKLVPIKKWQKVLLATRSENLRKMIFAISQDLRPIFVMLAGRLDELRNLESFAREHHPDHPQDYQKRKSIEALEILAPLAYGLGMGEIKGEFEDLAFPHLYPKEYHWLLELVKEKFTEREKYLAKLKEHLEKILTKEGIKVLDIHSRAKHYFSLYQKLLRHEMDIEKIYDLVAQRIIVPDVESCYRALGAIHKVWSPLPGRIKDYISSPKQNGYRSLHTTVACGKGRIIEFQIKTPQMHREAEYGIAGHLSYKGRFSKKTYRYQFYWLDQLRKWQEELKDFQKISSYLKSKLFKDKVFVFTPKGDVIDLPKGSCCVDFAYALHTEIGEHCQGAKVNGKLVPLNYVLQTGERIEILTDKNKIPSSDWLRFVKTQKARSKIKNFLQKAYGIFPEKKKKKSLKEKITLIKKILPIRKERKLKILIGGESGISVKLSKCCSPQPTDEISAFITKGKGASVHKIDCQNIKELQEKWPKRIVEATWISEKNKNNLKTKNNKK